MANNYVPGHLTPVQWQATGGALATLSIKSHNLDISVLLHDVTSTRHAGVRARLAGPLDAAGTVNNALDLDVPPYLTPPTILPGVGGVAAWGLSSTRAIQLPLICEKLGFTSAIEQEVQWNADWKMDARQGVVIYPAL